MASWPHGLTASWPAGWFRMPFLRWPFARCATSNPGSSCRLTSLFRPSRSVCLLKCPMGRYFHMEPSNHFAKSHDLLQKWWFTSEFLGLSKEVSSFIMQDTAVPSQSEAPFETVLRWQSDEPKAGRTGCFSITTSWGFSEWRYPNSWMLYDGKSHL